MKVIDARSCAPLLTPKRFTGGEFGAIVVVDWLLCAIASGAHTAAFNSSDGSITFSNGVCIDVGRHIAGVLTEDALALVSDGSGNSSFAIRLPDRDLLVNVEREANESILLMIDPLNDGDVESVNKMLETWNSTEVQLAFDPIENVCVESDWQRG